MFGLNKKIDDEVQNHAKGDEETTDGNAPFIGAPDDTRNNVSDGVAPAGGEGEPTDAPAPAQDAATDTPAPSEEFYDINKAARPKHRFDDLEEAFVEKVRELIGDFDTEAKHLLHWFASQV